MDYDKLAKEFGGSAYEPTEQPDIDSLAKQFGGSLEEESKITKSLKGIQENLIAPFKEMVQPTSSVLEGKTLTPQELKQPATGPNLADAVYQAKMAQPYESKLDDYAKLLGGELVSTTAGMPEGIEAMGQGMARDTTFKPSEILNYIADPRKLTNDITQSIGLPKVFQNKQEVGIVPEKALEQQKLALDKTLTESKIKSFRNLKDWGQKYSTEMQDSLSPEMKLALANSEPTGNLIKSLETWDFSDLSMGKDPSIMGITGQAVKVFGSAVPVIASAIITKKPGAAAVTGAAQASSEGVSDAQQYIEKMDFKELSDKSEYFRNLLVLGYKPEDAKRMTVAKAGDTAAYMQGMVGALGGEFTGELLTGKLSASKLFSARNRALAIAKGATVGAAEEGLEEMAEGLATDLGINKTVVREMGVDSFANFVLGALGGVGPGAVGGATAQVGAPAEPTETQKRIQEFRERLEPGQVQAVTDAINAGIKTKADAVALADTLGIDVPENFNKKQIVESLKNIVQYQEPTAAEEKPQEKQAPSTITPVMVEPTPPVAAAPAPIVGQAIQPEEIEEAPAAPAVTPPVAQAPIPAAPPVTPAKVEAPAAPVSLDQKAIKDEFVGEMPATRESIKPFEMGENTEYRVFQTDKGWTAGLFDKDANQLVTSRTWPFKEFSSAIGKQRAIAFADEEARKAKPYIEPKTQAQINQERQEAQRAIAAVTDAEKAAQRKIIPQEFNQDEINTVAQIVKRGNGAEYTEGAFPLLKKLEKAGLVNLKGKGKVYFTKLAEDAGIKGGSSFNAFSGSPDMQKLESFLKPKKEEAPKAEVKAEEVQPEVKKAYEPPKLRTDNPGGSWLENKRQQSIEAGKNKFGNPSRFGATTGTFKRSVLIPVNVLAKLKGINAEQENIRPGSLEPIKKIMDETGRLPQNNSGEDYVPFINVYQDGTAYVNEGNHRIMAAKALGFEYLPVDIAYFNGGEQIETGDLPPKDVISYDMEANDNKFSLDNYRGEKKARDLGTEAYPFERTSTELKTSKEGFIADKEGNPITFYHTTRAVDENGNQIKELIPGGPDGTGSGKAIWFGADPNKIQAAHNAPVGKEGSYTIPAHIKIDNPLYIDQFNGDEMREKWGPDLPWSMSDQRRQKLIDSGFDGIIWENNKGKIEEVVVFNKDQVTFTTGIKKPQVKVSENKVFTEDAAEKARELLKSKLNTLYSGIDPELLQAGIVLSGYHVEKGARTFAAYSKAMIADLGEAVKPYLKSWYMALKFDPRSESFKEEMDSAESVEKAKFEETEKPDLLDPDQKFAAAEDISKALLQGREFKDIRDARQFLQQKIGRVINPGTALAKEADEAFEVAVVLAAQQIVKEEKTPEDVYDRLVKLYDQQPGLNVRTSESIAQQAYSTPAPLAYIASQLAGIDNKTTVYEPTAGNGMLLIGADPKNVVANELNATRFEMLKRVLPGAEIVNKDALKFSPELSDVIIANPPFGSTPNVEHIFHNGAIKTREIDHAIAYTALERMPVDGRAVLIVGGVRGDTEETRKEGYRSAQKRNFYHNLYSEYNVVDHFTVAGNLYAKQGAKYPVDVIVINGKGASARAYPAADLPQIYSSYEQLKEKLDEASRMESAGAGRTAGVVSGEAAVGRGEPQPVGAGAVRPSERVSAEGEKPAAVSEPGVLPVGGAAGERAEPARAKPSVRESESINALERGDRGTRPVPFSGEGAERGVGTDVQRSDLGSLGGPSTSADTRVKPGLIDKRGLEAETETQVTYIPESKGASVGTLMPKAMAQSIKDSLKRLVNIVGNIDDYVSKSLKLDVKTLFDNFSAEQIDALGLAIHNAQAGNGFIIGDQTGIGKGRVVAGMIKYALVSGKIPIFVTEKPNLYSDMIRDLDDIGMTKELGLESPKTKIFITNSSETIPYQLVRKDSSGEPVALDFTLKSPKTGKNLEAMMKDMINKNSLGEYKVIFTTYSQLQSVKEKMPERAKFIKHFGENNYMIFDESHNAGGAGPTRGKEEGPEGRAAFVRSLVNKAYGTFFSSATYAKRPDVMDLYSSTNMKLAVDKPAMLAEAIKHGGVPMQQIVATMLTKDGQYIRRERTFKGVAYDTQETVVDKQTAENMATAMRDILSFSRKKDVVLKQMQKELDKEAKIVSEFGGEKTSIQGANFGAIMHNLIDQMLLSLKAQDSIKHAIERLKAGEKVVMTVSNTMGSFLQSYAEDMDIKVGDAVDLSFSDLYVRYLDKQRWIKIKGPDGDKLVRLTDEELGPSLVAEYERIENQIRGFGFGSAPISPIDYMHNELRKAGYKTDEITGRTIILNYAGGKPVLQTRQSNIKQRVNAVKAFNNGDSDVIILNQAGSTGLSLHASENVKDQRKRHMIIVQPEKNIDTHMQMLGRVHRTGQVITPSYSQMMADIPAEMRPAAVLMKKMASLNANTTASRKSAVTAEGVVDFMNEYGGQVALDFLQDNVEVHEALGGDRLLKLGEEEGKEEDIRRLTGYIPILPIKQQEEVYKELIERYNELLERENAMGTNKLEAKAVDLDAETVSREPVTEDKGEASIFSQPAYMERVDVKRTVKPFSLAEVEEMVTEHLDGKTKAEKNGEMRNDAQERARAYVNEQVAKMEAAETDPLKVQAFKDNMNAMYAKVKMILDTYRIGDSVSIKDPNNIFTYGVVTNVVNSKKTANPLAGSDWKIHIALANGEAKSLDINFSQLPTKFELKVVDRVDWLNPETNQGEYIPVKEIFDKGATVRREKRWMITGNILGGFSKYPGQIITYTRKDGTIGQGVLMSRQFDFEKAKKEAPVTLRTADQAMRVLTEIGGDIGTDENMLVIKRRGTRFEFETPRSKRQGGEYFGNTGLTDIIGSFYSRGSYMLASVYREDQVKQAIQYLMDEMDKTLVVKTGTEKAREMLAPKLSQEEINQQRQADRVKEGGDFYNNFSQNVGEEDIAKNIPAVREDIIKEYAALRQAGRRMIAQVAKYGSTVPLQRQLNEMLAQEQNLKAEIDATKPVRNSAEDFMARATKALANGEITQDVEAFIRRMYEKHPGLLEGLRLSIKEKKTEGKAAGNFDPFKRMVTLWRHTAGVTKPSTARHEIMHSAEQLMTAGAREAVITEWAKALETAMRENVDKRSRDYFDAVLVFLANPTKENMDAATNKLPSYDFYQYLNPSEYWAINAEKLMEMKLGTPWQRFVVGFKGLIEGLKKFFGFNNKYAIHQALNAILKGEKVISSQDMLMDYIADGKYKIRLLENIQDEQDVVDKYGIPEVPGHDPRTMKDMMVGSWEKVRDFAEQHNKRQKVQTEMTNAIEKGWDSTTWARIKNVWFGAGLDEADLKKYKGQIRTENGMAIASVAVKNAIHSGSIATQVILRGGLEYSQRFGQFIAVERDNSMANVVRGQYDLRKKLGRKLADQIINGFFSAKRTRGIQNDYLTTLGEVENLKDALAAATDVEERAGIEAELAAAQQALSNIKIAYEKVPFYLCALDEEKPYITKNGERIPNVKYGVDGLPIINDEAVDDLIGMANQHSELNEMMSNWTAVNHNMLDNLAFSGRISKKEAEKLKSIKDYVPWYRLMDEEEPLYDSGRIPGNTSGVKHFEAGRTERDIDNVVDSMLHNVSIMTRSAIRNYANNRVAMEYAERRMIKGKKKGEMVPGRIKVYPTTGRDETGVRLPIFANGRRVVVKIPDAQIAEAILGMAMPAINYPFKEYFSTTSQVFRRTITFSGYFQVKQLVYDAPTAAWVSGVKNPFAVWGRTFSNFIRAYSGITKEGMPMDDATIKVMQAAGIGGFQSFHRTEKKERALELGLIEHKNLAKFLKFADRVGDASDYAQRMAVYKQVLKESGDPALALLQASDIVDWQKHGTGRIANAARSSVTFIQAWATQLDALAQAAMGKGFKGKTRSQALRQFATTAGYLSAVTILYAMAAAGDDDYWELDDMTRARNFYIPGSKKAFGHHVLIPMHSSAAYFFKVIPEMLYTTYLSQGTKNAVDRSRLARVLGRSAADMVLGPEPVPTGIKAPVEIAFNHSFFTGKTITPKNLEGLDAAEQYNAATSELGKWLSAMTGTAKTRVLNPVEADHFIRGTFGSAGALAQWFSSELFGGKERPTPQLKENPLFGGIIAADVQRKNEDLFYDLKDKTEKEYNTFKRLHERGRHAEAEAYLQENKGKIQAHAYVLNAEAQIKGINKEIRRIGETSAPQLTPDKKRERINQLTQIKNNAMRGTMEMRERAGL